MRQLSLDELVPQETVVQRKQSAKTTSPKVVTYVDETRNCDAIFLGADLFTAEGTARVFLRVFPEHTAVVERYLAALAEMRSIYKQATVRPSEAKSDDTTT